MVPRHYTLFKSLINLTFINVIKPFLDNLCHKNAAPCSREAREKKAISLFIKFRGESLALKRRRKKTYIRDISIQFTSSKVGFEQRRPAGGQILIPEPFLSDLIPLLWKKSTLLYSVGKKCEPSEAVSGPDPSKESKETSIVEKEGRTLVSKGLCFLSSSNSCRVKEASLDIMPRIHLQLLWFAVFYND